MAHPDISVAQEGIADLESNRKTDLSERRLRRISIWIMLFFLFQGSLGAVWDREWHAYVGRDQFWTPPHALIYSCAAGVGLMALGLVLAETWRSRCKRANANEISTVRVLVFFSAPLGFIITGSGALLALIAAPLDNYWHELFGIDVALWAPFHLMGITGAMIGIVGMVYVFAAEEVRDRRLARPVQRFLGLTALEWGVLLVLGSLMNFILIGFLQFPVPSFGSLSLSTYPLPLVMSATFCFTGAIRFTGRPGAALLIVLFLLLNTVAVELFIPWAIRAGVALEGLEYRSPGKVPMFSWAYALLPLIFLIPAFLIDSVAFWGRRHLGSHVGKTARSIGLIGLFIAPLIVLPAPFVLQSYSSYAPIFLPQTGLLVPPGLTALVLLVFFVSVLGTGALGAILGAEFGDVWRWNTH